MQYNIIEYFYIQFMVCIYSIQFNSFNVVLVMSVGWNNERANVRCECHMSRAESREADFIHV